jgi:hypothetical protein
VLGETVAEGLLVEINCGIAESEQAELMLTEFVDIVESNTTTVKDALLPQWVVIVNLREKKNQKSEIF